jgi:hypothetical protein
MKRFDVIRLRNTPIRYFKYDLNKYRLYDSKGEFIASFKTRDEAVNYNHQIEISKITRIKGLEQLYSRYERLSLWGVS